VGDIFLTCFIVHRQGIPSLDAIRHWWRACNVPSFESTSDRESPRSERRGTVISGQKSRTLANYFFYLVFDARANSVSIRYFPASQLNSEALRPIIHTASIVES
jgi:hypothetical protein